MAGFKNVQSQVFDVKPVTKKGEIDYQKIRQVTAVLDLSQAKTKRDLEEERQAAKLKAILAENQAKAVSKEQTQNVAITVKAAMPAAEPLPIAQEPLPPSPLFKQPLEDFQQDEYFQAQIGKTEEEKVKKELEEIRRETAKETREEMPYRVPEQMPFQGELKPSRPFLEPGKKTAKNYFDQLLPSLEEKSRPPAIEDSRLPTKDELLDELSKIEKEDIGLKTTLVSKPVFKKKKKKIKETPQAKTGFQALADQVSQNLDGSQELLMGTSQAALAKKELFKLPALKVPTLKIPKKTLSVVLALILGISIVTVGFSWAYNNISVKNKLLGSSLSAYSHLLAAKSSLALADWDTASNDFYLAYQNFYDANQKLSEVSSLTSKILEALGDEKEMSAAKTLLAAGENIAAAGQDFSEAFALMDSLDFNQVLKEISDEQIEGRSNAQILAKAKLNLEQAKSKLKAGKNDLNRLDTAAITADLKNQTDNILKQIPGFEEVIDQSIKYLDFGLSALGRNTDQRYLLIFQNPSEARASGGLIGTYGVLELENGSIRDLKVEGIYNLDSQLREKIVPPKPLQKISTAWSAHDANWFADFPTSADKVIWFYERSGGLPVDGLISLTPLLIEKLLKLSGPIEMQQYDVTLGADNFVEQIQYKVEEDFDKELNQPKKILADFAPKLIDALKGLSAEKQEQAKDALMECLAKKHLLFYFTDSQLQKFVQDHGWSGELIKSDKDYLSVVSSNIGSDKTDRYIDQSIVHQAEIENDGSVIDTVTITRQHNGGNTSYSWYNQTNLDYLRLYVPLGSQLISVAGNSAETIKAPLDYKAQGFRSDPLIQSIENNLSTKSYTDIFTESGKTVFGSWLKTRAGRSAKLTIKYRLPFKVNLTRLQDSYTLLVQKQAGSKDSIFSTSISYPEDWQIISQEPQDWKKSKLLI